VDVKKFLTDKINAGFAASTVTHMKNCLSGALNLAIDDEVIQANPAQKLGRVIRSRGLQLDIDPLNREEIGLLLDSFQEHYPAHYPMALTLARTGMRLGEALALQWGDIDFHGRFINIQRNFSRGKIETPKSGKSRRVVMSLQLSEVLRDLRHQRRLDVAKKGWGASS
jgi:integrase